MTKAPGILCDGWKDGEMVPIAYTASREANIQPSFQPQPENRKPSFTFTDVPAGTENIALVVHDVLEGEPVNGERPGWTHYTALFSPEGLLLEEGKTSESEKGWVGPYPEGSGEYHCTAYFLSESVSDSDFSRSTILGKYDRYGLGKANLVGKYTNPLSNNQ